LSSLGHTIRHNQALFLVWGGLEEELKERLISNEQETFLAATMNELNSQLTQAVSITASIDCAVFEDGTAVGLDSAGLVEQLQAQVQAKKDLLQMVHHQYFTGLSPRTILDMVQSMADNQSQTTQLDNSPDSHYKYYKKLFAEEIANMRKVSGDDKQVIGRALQPLRKKWKVLSKESARKE
jgi:hypothetical protein